MEFIERLDAILKEKSLTRKNLADACGISYSAISMWTTRGSIPSGDTCFKIASFLNTSVEYLVTGKDDTPIGSVAQERLTALVSDMQTVINKTGIAPPAGDGGKLLALLDEMQGIADKQKTIIDNLQKMINEQQAILDKYKGH